MIALGMSLALGTSGVILAVWGLREWRLDREGRDEHKGATEAYGDELRRIRVQLAAQTAVQISRSPMLGWLAPTGEHPTVQPLDPGTYGRRRRPVRPAPRMTRYEAPHCTRTVVPVAPPPAWAVGYQPGPITREFQRIVGAELARWEQAELDLAGVR